MLAASYWSLLAPAIELAQASGLYGNLTFLPIALGFAAGAVFVYVADILLAIMVWLSLPHSSRMLLCVTVGCTELWGGVCPRERVRGR